MALEAVVFPQDHFGYVCRDSPYALPWCDMAGFGELCGDWGSLYSAEECEAVSKASDASPEREAPPASAAAGRRKRRRAKAVKNKEDIESQRMIHIAVERNRRRQMNEYLAVLRSLMPPSYAQRGDQASIVGGAINYVRELEQLLQSLEVQKNLKRRTGSSVEGQAPFAGLFCFPQYSVSQSSCSVDGDVCGNAGVVRPGEMAAASRPAVADIEVTMVEGHANLKLLAQRRPKQLLKLVAGLQQLRIPPLHLNMTTVDGKVLYSFSLKVEEDSKFNSVEEIATAVHEILGRIQEEAGFS